MATSQISDRGVFANGDSLSEIAQKTLDTGRLKELSLSIGVGWLVVWALSMVFLQFGLRFRPSRVLSLLASCLPYEAVPGICLELFRVIILAATYVVWPALLISYGVTVMNELDPVHVGMSLLAMGFMVCLAAYSAASFVTFNYRFSLLAKLSALAAVVLWLAWEVGVVYTVEPFSYIGLSAVMLALNMFITIFMVYTSQRSPRVKIDTFGAFDFDPDFDLIVPKNTSLKLLGMYVASLAFLAAYAVLVDNLTPVGARGKYVGYITMGAIVVLDVCILFVINSVHSTPPVVVALVVVLSRYAVIFWGPDYWLIGHATLFFIVGTAFGLTSTFELIRDPQDRSLKILGDDAGERLAQLKGDKMRESRARYEADKKAAESQDDEDAATEMQEEDDDEDKIVVNADEGIKTGPACCHKVLFGSSLRMLVFITVLYVAELVALARYEKQVDILPVQFTESGETYAQWTVAIGSLLLTIILPSAMATFRLFITGGKVVSYRVIGMGVWTEVITVGSGYYFWRISGVYILLTTSIFLPGILLTGFITYRRWISNDFFFLPKDMFSDHGVAVDEEIEAAARAKLRKERRDALQSGTVKKGGKKGKAAGGKKKGGKKGGLAGPKSRPPPAASTDDEATTADEMQEEASAVETVVDMELQETTDPSSDGEADLPKPNRKPKEPFSYEKFFKLRYPGETYEILVGAVLYIALSIAYGTVVRYTSTPEYAGPILSYALTVPLFAFLPLYKYFNSSRVVTPFIVACIAVSYLESILFSLLMWYFVYDQSFNAKGAGLLAVVAGHLVFMLLYMAYQYRMLDVNSRKLDDPAFRAEVPDQPINDDDRVVKKPWPACIPGLRQMPRHTRVAAFFIFSAVLVVGAFVAVVLYFFEPVVVGYVLAAAYLIAVYLIYLAYIYQYYDNFLPMHLRVSSLLLVAVMVAMGVLVGYASNAIVGYSIAWAVIFVCFTLFAVSQTEYVRGVKLIYSTYVFPVYAYDPRNEKLVEDSYGTFALLAALFCAFSWGIVATVYLFPVYVGVTVSMVSAVFVFIFLLEATLQQRIRFGQAIVDAKLKSVVQEQRLLAIDAQVFRRPPIEGMSEDDHWVRVANFSERRAEQAWAEHEARTAEDMKALWEFDERTNAFWEDNQRMKALAFYLISTIAAYNNKQEQDLVRVMFEDLGFKGVSQKAIEAWAAENPDLFDDMLADYLKANAELLEDEKRRAQEDEKAGKERKLAGTQNQARKKRKEKQEESDSDREDIPDGWETPESLYSISSEDGWSDLSDYSRSVALYNKTLAVAKERYERTGEKFVDKDFAPIMRSVYLSETSKGYKKRVRKVKAKTYSGWRRPEDLEGVNERDLRLFQQIDPGDVIQGALGNCWFISSISVLGSKPDLVRAAFTPAEVNPYGVYGVTFYKEGTKEMVVVDDMLPVGGKKNPLFARSADPNELWPMLMEKAYAKLHGTYEALVSGRVADGLADLTGGIPQMIRTQEGAQKTMVASGALFAKLLEYHRNGYLLGAGSPSGSSDTKTVRGIHQTHQYSILRVVELSEFDPATGRPIQLIQMRNPWGKGEWTGAWSDNDTERWTRRRRTLLKMSDANDGVFWISFEDFVLMFPYVFVCKIYDGQWHLQQREAYWRPEGDAQVIERPRDYTRLFNTGYGGFDYEAMEMWEIEVWRPTRVVTLLIQEDSRVGATTRAATECSRSIRCDVWKKKTLGGGYVNVAYSGKAAAARAETDFTTDVQVLCEMYLYPGKYVVCCRAGGEYDAWDTKHPMQLKVYSNYSVRVTPGPEELSSED